MKLFVRFLDSMIGKLLIGVDEQGALVRIEFVKDKSESDSLAQLECFDVIWDQSKTEEASNQLTQYFDGERSEFTLKLNPQGTEFQKQVWRALMDIPFGETRSYRDIAIQIGNLKAVRAVGAANGKNPLPIVAPCHRVIGSNGALTGYAGGLDIKRKLLAHEGRL